MTERYGVSVPFMTCRLSSFFFFHFQRFQFEINCWLRKSQQCQYCSSITNAYKTWNTYEAYFQSAVMEMDLAAAYIYISVSSCIQNNLSPVRSAETWRSRQLKWCQAWFLNSVSATKNKYFTLLPKLHTNLSLPPWAPVARPALSFAQFARRVQSSGVLENTSR